MTWSSAVWIVLTLLSLSVNCEKGSCRASRKCCDGKDPDCLVQDVSESYLDEYEEVEPCYCDHGCLDLGDCCPDFKDYCGVFDCHVSPWSSWSECDSNCGKGTATRTRNVVRPESNGGQQCPNLEERRPCENINCLKQKSWNVPAIRETAILLPGKFARQNIISKKKYDVRENLKSYKKKIETEQYCVVFQVNKALRGCQQDMETEKLVKGNTVCVVCDSKAQRDYLGGRCMGHGIQGEKSRFKAILSSKCHGKWTRLEVQKECPCKDGPDFTLV